jgi:hypothetical protein
MNLIHLLNNKMGKYIISFLLGLGLASLFRVACKDKNCVLLKSHNDDEFNKKIYKIDNKCYRFNQVSTKCDSNMKTVEYE